MKNTLSKPLTPIFFFLLSLIIIFVTYSLSLNREWQFFDERLFYNEGLFPIPKSFTEIFEIISTYAFNYHIDSQNTFFSNIINIRTNSLGAILNIVISYFFQKNAIYYHLLQVFVHITNSSLVWFIFFRSLNPENTSTNPRCLIPTLLTLIWSLHPVNIEAVLLLTNWNCLLNHTFCLGFFLYIQKKAQNNHPHITNTETLLIAFLYIISLFIYEYSYILPIILFFLAFALNFKKIGVISNSLINSTKACIPFFIGFITYVFIYIVKSLFTTKSSSAISQFFNFSFERPFYLAPQLFFHFLKLFFYPKDLSLYQSNLLKLSNSTFDPHMIFTLIIFLFFLTAPILFFIFFKSTPNKSFVFLLFYSFLFSLFPFFHIISPTYCLIAERYCYFPLFVFIFMLVQLINIILSPSLTLRVNSSEESHIGNRSFALLRMTTTVLFILLIVFGIRTYTRILDWKDTFSLYNSALKCNGNELYRGQLYSILGYYFNKTNKKEQMEKYFTLSIKEFETAIKNLKMKQKINPPKTLITYGLDPDALLITCAFSTSETKMNYLNWATDEVLNFYEPFIKPNIDYAGSSQLDLYAKLLLKMNKGKEAENILEFAHKKYPFSPIVIYTLSNLYLKQNNLEKASQIIEEGYKYYPSYPRMLLRMIKLSTIKKDYNSLARYEYLLGLRTHSIQGYQKALQIYLSLNKLNDAKRTIDKLLLIDKRNPVTLLLLSNYFHLTGRNNLILPTLEEAYKEAKKQYHLEHLNLNIYKSILLSLISFNSSYNKLDEVKKYTSELKELSK